MRGQSCLQVHVIMITFAHTPFCIGRKKGNHFLGIWRHFWWKNSEIFFSGKRMAGADTVWQVCPHCLTAICQSKLALHYTSKYDYMYQSDWKKNDTHLSVFWSELVCRTIHQWVTLYKVTIFLVSSLILKSSITLHRKYYDNLNE